MTLTYLDNNATTQPAPQVAAAMMPLLNEAFGNPSSAHVLGQRAAYCVQEARRRVAGCLGAVPEEIVFTSGGTESDNLAIRGALAAAAGKRHLVTTTVEHEAVLRLIQQLERQGCDVTYLEVDQAGRIDAAALRAAITDDTAVVSIMLANNETGILFPIAEIAEHCRQRGAVLHCDAVQAVGKMPIDVNRLGVDLLSLSAHKFHGPKGVGALYLRRGVALRGEIIGGFQERDLRGGTENVPGIVGLGIAAALVSELGPADHQAVRDLRDTLEAQINAQIPGAMVIGEHSPRLPNTTLVGFEGATAEQILIGLSERGICASGGSACHSGSLEPSRVLQAMGVAPRWALGTIRLSLSRYSTAAEIDQLMQVLPEVVATARRRGQPSCPN